MDALSDILALTRLASVVYFRTSFSAPWGMAMGASDVAQFHLIVRGQCFLEVPGVDADPRPLSSGDILVLPHGHAHALSDHPASDRVPGTEVLHAHRNGAPLFQGGTEITTMVCGHFEFDRRFDHCLLRDLPPLIHLQHWEHRQLSWLETVTTAIVQESGSAKPGAEVVVGRLAEVLFVQILRSYIAQQKPSRSYLAALQDERISAALAIIHKHPHADLGLDHIARTVGMSRSAFANRFKELVGTTPMRYANDWRMLKARELLEASGAPIARICEQVGYLSEAAFNRAFKAKFGQTPGAIRRAGALR
jgi:AraC-like DNA-binding protein